MLLTVVTSPEPFHDICLQNLAWFKGNMDVSVPEDIDFVDGMKDLGVWLGVCVLVAASLCMGERETTAF